jgi:superfamily I DNA and/or RNA helicase
MSQRKQRETRLTAEQRSIYRTIPGEDALVLTLTNGAAQNLLDIAAQADWKDQEARTGRHQEQSSSRIGDDADDDDDDDYFFDDENGLSVRSEAYHLNARLRRVADVFVTLKDRAGSRGDPIYEFAVQPDGLEGFLRFTVAAKDDCLLVIGANHSFFQPPTQSVRWLGGCCLSESSEPLPVALANAFASQRDAKTVRADVDRNIAVWEKFLDVQEQDAKKRQYSVRYIARRTGDQPDIQRLTLDTVAKDVIDKLRHCRDLLEVFFRAPDTGEDDAWEDPLTRVRVVRYLPESKALEVRIDEDDAEQLHRAANRMPRQGWLANRELGTTVQIERQKRAIQRLRHGQARLPSLDQLLYGEDAFRPPDIAPAEPLAPEQCLRPDRINEDQRAAVSLALATPDCFFLQGPPGTGKTTFIAELCYQAARAGQRVLVSSQTNLAVDNALSRLENQAEILATRLGNPKSIDDDGLPFVGEQAVQRWLSAVAARAKVSIQRMEKASEVIRRTLEHLPALRAWRSRGYPMDHDPRVAIDDIVNDLKHVRAVLHEASDCQPQLLEAQTVAGQLQEKQGLWRALVQRMHRAEMAVRNGLKRDSVELCPPLASTLRRLDALLASADASDRCAMPPEEPLPAVLRAYAAAERQGAEDKAESFLQLVEQHLRFLRKKAGMLFLGLLHRSTLNEARMGVLKTGRELLAEVTASGVPLTHLRDAAQAAIASMQLRIKALDAEESALRGRLDAILAPTATSRLMQAAHSLQLITGRQVTTDLLGSFDQAVRSARAMEENLENRLAAAVWADVSAACGPEASIGGHVDERPLAGRLRNTTPDPRSPDLSILEDLSERYAPHRLRAALGLLAEWSQYLTSNVANIDDQLQAAFDQSVNVVGATCSMTASGRFLARFPQFDMVIVDEVSKATATELLLPTLLGKRVILVGDHKQLEPMLGDDIEGDSYQDAAASLGLDTRQFGMILGRSLFRERFERLKSIPASHRAMMLKRQYRMHTSIMRGINQFYDGALMPGTPDLDSQKDHDLHEGSLLPRECHVAWIDLPDQPDWFSEPEPGTKSSVNAREAELVALVAERFLSPLQARGRSLGIISLYAGQARLIRRELDRRRVPQQVRQATGLRVSTVDRFQGTERDVVIVSLCANGRRPSSFLRTPNRINVAMSRARRLLIIVGSSATFCRQHGEDSHYGIFLKIARSQRGYLHAQEFLETR